jgi:hypothetical protein
MEISFDAQQCPDVSIVEHTSSELIKLVRKLRWIGMDEEAMQMQALLRRIDSAAVLLADPQETD